MEDFSVQRLAYCQQLAQKRNGNCTSTIYKNNKTKLSWQCEKGHVWQAILPSIEKGTWCSKCDDEKQRHGIDFCKEFAIKRGGECLSVTYKSAVEYLEWKCADGHTWKAKFCSIKNGNSWCPHCPKTRVNTDKCVKLAKLRDGYCLSEYIDAKTPLNWKCNAGHVWQAIEAFLIFQPTNKGSCCLR